jgi:uncharacterized protein
MIPDPEQRGVTGNNLSAQRRLYVSARFFEFMLASFRSPCSPRSPWSFCVLGLLFALPALAQVPVPLLRAPVTDLTNTLTPDQIATLDQRLRQFEATKGSQIAVLFVPTTQPETIEQYSIRVAEGWRLGREDADDGVLLLVAKEDRTVRIEVGHGLEGALPDVLANRITDQVIVPRFREGDFYGGVVSAIDRIIALVEGEPLPEPLRRPEDQAPQGIGSALPIVLMLVFVASGILRRMFGAFGGAFVTGGVAGVLVWILTSALGIAIGAAVIAFLFTVMSGGGGGRGWTSSRRGHHWGGGGFGGGWGGGGFGGGGWSGGGGSFGGGGASGRW